jgi:TP901 family phage tail tape measure protein
MAKNFSVAVIIKAIDKATSVFNGISDSAGKAGKKISDFGKGWSANVSLPLAGLSAISFKASADFDDVMDKLLTQTDASREQVELWRDQILRDAPDMGVAPLALAEGLLAAVSAGEAGRRAYETMAEAAVGARLQMGSVKDLVDIATGVTENYGKENINTKEALEILLATVNQGKGEANEYAQVMGKSVSMAQALRVSFNDVGAAIAAFTVKNIPAAQAATQIEAIFRNLTKITPAAAKEFKRLGFTYDGLQKSLQERGLYQTLQDINTAAEGSQRVLSIVFPETEAFAGVLQLVNDEGGKVKVVFDALRNPTATLAAQLEKVKDSSGQVSRGSLATLATVGIEFGRALATFLVPALRAATGLLKAAGAWFQDLSPGMQKLTVGAVLAAVALGPLITAVGSLTVAVMVALPLLAAISAPVWLAIGAVAALAVGVTWFVRDWKGAVRTILNHMPFGTLIEAAARFAMKLWDMDLLAAGKRLINSLWEGLKAGWDSVSRWFSDSLQDLLDLVPDWLLPGSDAVYAAAGGSRRAPPPGAGAPRPPGPGLGPALAAVRGKGSMVPWKDSASKADVTVAFKNTPPGTRVSGKGDKGVGLTLDTGYAMAY